MVDGLDSLRKAACDAEPDPEPRAPTAMADAPGTGLAAVETARGLLVHRVTQAGGRIADWRVLAPTEWTFHPEGALPATVTGWDAGDPAALVRRVRRLVAAMDPCVTCDIRVEEAARA
jgi:coenzyme F420-reducing hydrogenase alpha subunit